MTLRGVILDIDGTLIDSNDAHAHSWIEAMSEQGYSVDFDKVRPLIGMGGDKVLPAVLNISKDSSEGKKMDQRCSEIFQQRYLPDVRAFPHTHEFLQHMHDQGLKLVVATSSKQEELNKLLTIIGPHVSDLFTQETTSSDAPQSKPDPEVMDAALQKANFQPDEVIMIGDTAFDIEAASKAAIKTIALRCGGWSDADLKGAIAIYDDPADLLAHYGESPLAQNTKTTR
ncbi:MAG: HAD family hydrolase [Ktedonobacteraceae bacterium]|nr:HAD family hydrolase [Ktedonobacteraceae bacterium]